MSVRFPASAPPFLRPTPDGVRIAVRVTPKANADRVDGIYADATGTRYLAIKVRAAPEKGGANAAAAAVLAKALGVAKRSVNLSSGATSRTKTFTVNGDAEWMARRAQDLARS